MCFRILTTLQSKFSLLYRQVLFCGNYLLSESKIRKIHLPLAEEYKIMAHLHISTEEALKAVFSIKMSLPPIRDPEYGEI